MEDDLKKKWEKNGRRPKKKRRKKGKTTYKKWKTNQSTKFNLIGCDTIENWPNYIYFCVANHYISEAYFVSEHESFLDNIYGEDFTCKLEPDRGMFREEI